MKTKKLKMNNIKLAIDYIAHFRRFVGNQEISGEELFKEFCFSHGLNTIKGKNLFLTLLQLMGFERKLKIIKTPNRTSVFVYIFKPHTVSL